MRCYRFVIFIFLFFGSAVLAGAATNYSFNVASGSWSAAGSWSPGGGPPTATDSATISNGGTCNLAAGTTVTNLTITSGKLVSGNNSLTVTGTLNVGPGTLDLSGASLPLGWGSVPFQVTGVCTINTGGTITTGNNSMWFKSDLTLNGGTFDFSGITGTYTASIDVDGTLSATGVGTSVWTNSTLHGGTIRLKSADL